MLYRHYKTKGLYVLMGSAHQYSDAIAADSVEWLGLTVKNTENPEWDAELGIIKGSAAYMFRSVEIMPGKWAAYWPLEGSSDHGWIRPYGMFFGMIDSKTKRFGQVGTD